MERTHFFFFFSFRQKNFREHTERKHQTVPTELEEIVREDVTELPEHTVTITDISEIDLAGHGGTRLGLNTAEESDEDGEGEINSDNSDVETQVTNLPETSIFKHKRDMKKIKEKIFKTSKHLKKKSQKKPKRTLSKRTKHKLKCQQNVC
ncbi:uncharacterized protein LOC132752149 [Ruditapes philippinarum]|uniref:uncharacterized protein LOC132752149 n=1 Tax=Ruditapes philippinarum TaxID=129788 RepID=UPI00295B7D47|nr:uncharacterized protein LOC132752149 [Ruditapes philippinarum]